MKVKIISAILVLVGIISLMLGTLGIVLPLLPTVPFLLLTLICFTKGSKKFENRFKNTKLYKKILKPFLKKKNIVVSDKEL